MKEEGAPKESYLPEEIKSLRVGVVRARFNRNITNSLKEGVVSELRSVGVSGDQISVFEVPGAFELPRAVRRVLQEKPELDGIVAIGAVIRGETPHFDYICDAATDGLQKITLHSDQPVAFGVLTCDTLEQARARSRPDPKENKGNEAARALLDMIRFEQRVS